MSPAQHSIVLSRSKTNPAQLGLRMGAEHGQSMVAAMSEDGLLHLPSPAHPHRVHAAAGELKTTALGKQTFGAKASPRARC